MADVVELEDRLTRLENRIKTNFFDIEKKFADISEKSSEVPDERLQELEDLVLLIQLENTKLKEKLGTQETLSAEPGGIAERISKLESVIDQIKSGATAAPSNIEQRLAGLEQKLSTQVKEGIDSRLSKLDSDIKDLRIESGKMTPKEVDDNIAKINSARLELDNSILKFRALKDELEKGMTERQSLFTKLDQMEVNVEKAGAYFAKMRTSEEKISAIASKVESLNEGMDAKIKAGTEKIELIKRGIENRFTSTEERFKARLEKLDSTMESLDVKSGGIDEKIDELQSIGKDLADVAAIKTGVEEQLLRTASLERNLAAINKRISDIHKIKEEMEEEISIRASLEKKLEDMSVSVAGLNNVNAQLEEESALRMGLESRLQDITNELVVLRSGKAEIETAINHGLAQLDERMKSVGVDEQLAAFDKKLADVQQEIEAAKEPVTNAKEEIEKAAQKKMDEFSADIDEIKGALHLEDIRNIRNEIVEHRKLIQNLKADLEIAASRFFSSNLEEFAHALDKKFPGFVSKEDYTKHMTEISQRLKTIEAPDLSPLSARVEMLERKLNDVHNMMQSLARTMPIVLE